MTCWVFESSPKLDVELIEFNQGKLAAAVSVIVLFYTEKEKEPRLGGIRVPDLPPPSVVVVKIGHHHRRPVARTSRYTLDSEENEEVPRWRPH